MTVEPGGASRLAKAPGSFPLFRLFRRAPKVSSKARASALYAGFLASIIEDARSFFAADGIPRNLLLSIADHSPYLWNLITSDPLRLHRLLLENPDAALNGCLSRLREASDQACNEIDLMRLLRKAKAETALLIALADIGGVWDLVKVTKSLSAVADECIELALRFALRTTPGLQLADPSSPEIDCGMTVLALGKLGARDLNYSSDCDLIVLYDPNSTAIPFGAAPGPIYVKLTQKLVKLLQDRSVDGYVMRVDLRLRPDPGSTAVANSVAAAYDYYEMLGQNWERAALIKARPIAGDRSLGAEFIVRLQPFIWRKYLDYAAIADIGAMKRQIHAARGHAEIKIEGHDIKLGRGGIREIEFFVATQQLIFGGKHPDLRGRNTLEMLSRLATAGWIARSAGKDLRAAYIFFRNTEHRLQMINDEQTHQLPSSTSELNRFAHFSGFGSARAFAIEMIHHLQLVSFHYGRLFEYAEPLDLAEGSLAFTGVTDDPETLETLARLGFKHPERAVERVRGWHFGEHRAMRSPRAREVLTELVPKLLQGFARSGDPDTALEAFDSALAKMPASIELFSILKSNQRLCTLFGDILGSSPRLSRLVIEHPHVLDAIIDGSAEHAPLDAASFKARLARFLEGKEAAEERLDAMRDFAREEMFLIGVRLLSGRFEPLASGAANSGLAAAMIEAALHLIERDFARDYGKVRGGEMVILALGKLGSREMTAASDLDLMVIYDFDENDPQSDGKRSLHAVQYYTRAAQRLISALTVTTRRGPLYEVDMRLRPSGRKGPVATALQSFILYQSSEAETWEHLALTRARAVAGSRDLAQKIEAAIGDILRRPRGEALKRDVFEMRGLIAKVKGETDFWNLKLVSGGLIEIEFLAQYLVLAQAHQFPDVIRSGTREMIEQAEKCKAIGADTADELLSAHKLYSSILQMLRLMLDENRNPEDAPAIVKQRLARAGGEKDFSALKNQLRQSRQKVRYRFNSLLTPG